MYLMIFQSGACQNGPVFKITVPTIHMTAVETLLHTVVSDATVTTVMKILKIEFIVINLELNLKCTN